MTSTDAINDAALKATQDWDANTGGVRDKYPNAKAFIGHRVREAYGAFSKTGAAPATARIAKPLDLPTDAGAIKAKASAEWKANTGNIRETFISEEVYQTALLFEAKQNAKAAKATASTTTDPEAAAKQEWASMPAAEKSKWMDEKTFVTYRIAEAKGQIGSSPRS